MIETDNLDHSRAVRAARRVLACRRAAADSVLPAATQLLTRAAAQYESIVRMYADAALSGKFYSGAFDDDNI